MRLFAAFGRSSSQAVLPSRPSINISGPILSRQRRLWRAPSTHISSQYSSSSASAADSDETQQSSLDHESPVPTKVTIMSSWNFQRRATRSNAPSFDPSATAFAPGSNPPRPPPPPPGSEWQIAYGRQRGNPGPMSVGRGASNHMHYGTHRGQPSSTVRAGGPVEAPEFVSSSPSAGEPLPQLTPGQMETVTIPILGKSFSKQVKIEEKKRPYLVPTRASGGVPNPTKAYLTQSAVAPSLLPQPRKILVVIDLNGTLLHRPNHKKSATFVQRPNTVTFLDYCIRTFTVAIWSSAKPENVSRMVPQILSLPQQQQLVAVWGRDTLGLSEEDYNQRVQCYKRLESIWNDPRVAASHPEAYRGRRWDQTNTVLIDDSREKARSQPYNLIQLPEFTGDTAEQGDVLPQVHDYLNECAYQGDISSFMRKSPFKSNPNFQLGIPRDQNQG